MVRILKAMYRLFFFKVATNNMEILLGISAWIILIISLLGVIKIIEIW